MKAIVFTLDAVFALIIATGSISLLLYFHYTAPTPYAARYSEAASVLNLLSSTKVSALSNSSSIAQAIVQQSAGSNQTWDQQQKSSSRQGYASIGPSSAMSSFIYKANATIATPVVADYGKVYFAAANYLYSVNATGGTTQWVLNAGSSVYTSIALYDNMLIYANATNIAARSASTGALIWTTNTPLQGTSLSSQILVYNNEVIIGNNANMLYGLYASNGATAWSLNIGTAAGTITVASGEIIVETVTNALDGIIVGNNNPLTLWTLSYPASNPLSSVTAYNNLLFYGSGSNANVTYLNSTKDTSTSAGSQVSGVSSGNGLIVYQGSTTMLALNGALGIVWTKPMPSFLGTAITNATPVFSNNFVYSLWKNSNTGYGYLVAQNASNGNIDWYTSLPSQYLQSKPYMAIAYGRLYLVANNYVVAYGACNVQASSSVMAATASLYWSGSGGCASALLNAVYPTYNYSMSIGNAFAPDTNIANFDGSSASVYLGNSSSVETYSYTWSVWIEPTAWNAGNGAIIGEGSTALGAPYLIEQSNATAPYRIQFSTDGGNSAYTVYAPASIDSWQNVVATYSYGYNGILSIYVNGSLKSKVKIALPVARYAWPMYAGYFSPSGTYFTGQMANLQIYSDALNATQVAQLYSDGIQGGPLKSGIIAAWYPFSGDANDYSGNANTGYPYNVRYSNTNYTPSTLSNAYEVSKATSSILSNITTAQFNGYNSRVYIPSVKNMPTGAAPRTITVWYSAKVWHGGPAAHLVLGYGTENPAQAFQVYIGNGNADTMINAWNTDQPIPPQVVKNAWYFVAYEYTGSTQVGYVGANGNITSASAAYTYNTVATPLFIGVASSSPTGTDLRVFNGSIANVQFYNSTLTAQQIYALYDEGLMGSPIMPGNLLGWWPLNDNANDYSGNGNNGQALNVTFTPMSTGVIAWR